MQGLSNPPPGIVRQADAFARAVFPAMFTVVLLVVAATPTGVPGAVPALGLPCVFFWSVFRPTAMPPLAVFGLGLMQDLLSSAPLGSGVLILLIGHGVAVRGRGFIARQSFLTVWGIYILFATVSAALAWVAQAVMVLRLPPALPAAYQVLLTAGLYPSLAYVLIRCHRAIRRSEETTP